MTSAKRKPLHGAPGATASRRAPTSVVLLFPVHPLSRHHIETSFVTPVPSLLRFGPDAPWAKRLPPHLEALARRDPHTGAPSATGLLFGVPFRWVRWFLLSPHVKTNRKTPPLRYVTINHRRGLRGLSRGTLFQFVQGCLLIAFRADKLRQLGLGLEHGLEWADLWRPELAGRIAFPDEPRTLLGVALKAAGLPFDLPEGQRPSGAEWERIQGRVAALKRQARLRPFLSALNDSGFSPVSPPLRVACAALSGSFLNRRPATPAGADDKQHVLSQVARLDGRLGGRGVVNGPHTLRPGAHTGLARCMHPLTHT